MRLHLARSPNETPLAYQMLRERIAASDYLMILAVAGNAAASASLATISAISGVRRSRYAQTQHFRGDQTRDLQPPAWLFRDEFRHPARTSADRRITIMLMFPGAGMLPEVGQPGRVTS